jgi:hypothetical protein
MDIDALLKGSGRQARSGFRRRGGGLFLELPGAPARRFGALPHRRLPGYGQMIGLSALAQAEPKALVKILGPVFQQLVEGEQPHGNKLPKRDLTLPSKPGCRRSPALLWLYCITSGYAEQ